MEWRIYAVFDEQHAEGASGVSLLEEEETHRS
jgi:hypothetical protein